MLRIWTCSETRSPVFRPHDASALDSIDVLGLQNTLLIQRAFGRNGNPLIENRASLGVDGGRSGHLHDFPGNLHAVGVQTCALPISACRTPFLSSVPSAETATPS